MARSKQPLWWDVFIAEYLRNGQNAKAAYLKARPGVKPNAADAAGARLLANVRFLEVLNKRKESVEKKIGMSIERWMEGLRDVAEFDIRDFLEVDPTTKDVRVVSDWKTKPCGHVLTGLEISTATLDNGMVVQRAKIFKDGGKMKAYELIGKALGYLKDKVDVNVNYTLADVIPELKDDDES